MPFKKKVVEPETPVESEAPVETKRSPAEIFAHQRRLSLLSKKDGDKLRELLEKAGVKVYATDHEDFSIVRVRDAAKIIVDVK